jgi:hypothetical protein
MSAFCQQCSIEMFGKDLRELASEEEIPEGYGYPSICEGCGYVFVDADGKCVDNCLLRHNPDGGSYYNEEDRVNV